MPLTYCFAGSDIKARWHVAFSERSGAPSRLPVHLHNIATCHMETGITNLCLPLVARWPSYLLSYPNFVSFLPPTAFRSFFVAFFSCHVTSPVLARRGGAFLLTGKKIITVGNRETKFHTHTHTHNRNTHAQGLRGAAGVQGPHVNTSCEDCGDREKG